VNACASRHHKSRNPDRRIDHGHGQWSCGEGIARRASTDGVHRKSGNRGFRCQEFWHISIRETPNPDKGKGRGHESAVTWCRAHSRG
jgi:hypothetical protein